MVRTLDALAPTNRWCASSFTTSASRPSCRPLHAAPLEGSQEKARLAAVPGLLLRPVDARKPLPVLTCAGVVSIVSIASEPAPIPDHEIEDIPTARGKQACVRPVPADSRRDDCGGTERAAQGRRGPSRAQARQRAPRTGAGADRSGGERRSRRCRRASSSAGRAETPAGTGSRERNTAARAHASGGTGGEAATPARAYSVVTWTEKGCVVVTGVSRGVDRAAALRLAPVERRLLDLASIQLKYRLARRPQPHTVDAGPVQFSFIVSQPTVRLVRPRSRFPRSPLQGLKSAWRSGVPRTSSDTSSRKTGSALPVSWARLLRLSTNS